MQKWTRTLFRKLEFFYPIATSSQNLGIFFIDIHFPVFNLCISFQLGGLPTMASEEAHIQSPVPV